MTHAQRDSAGHRRKRPPALGFDLLVRAQPAALRRFARWLGVLLGESDSPRTMAQKLARAIKRGVVVPPEWRKRPVEVVA